MDFERLRKKMVEEQLKRRGIADARVLKAFLKIERHLFVPENERQSSYGDHPLSIGAGQTISQPYMAALMSEILALRGDEKVLEIGTGSGYQTAILAELAGQVYSIERIPQLVESAREKLETLGYTSVVIKEEDGTLGWKEYMPYDGIVVTAASPKVPQPLFAQLAEGGRMVIPVGGKYSQDLELVKKVKGKQITMGICGCVFVPLIGKHGWREND